MKSVILFFQNVSLQPNSTIGSVESGASNGSRKSWTRQYHTVNKTSTVVRFVFSKLFELSCSYINFRNVLYMINIVLMSFFDGDGKLKFGTRKKSKCSEQRSTFLVRMLYHVAESRYFLIIHSFAINFNHLLVNRKAL